MIPFNSFFFTGVKFSAEQLGSSCSGCGFFGFIHPMFLVENRQISILGMARFNSPCSCSMSGLFFLSDGSDSHDFNENPSVNYFLF